MAKLKITQIRSVIKRTAQQKKTVAALGLRKLNQTVEHEDSPQIRGMLDKVSHLVRIENA
ncbi:MAG: 50S ribosomal protein L30 [Bacteroidetes bacterium]|nr:50S ribosomal protein L30 [Bacteroidota bacterium]MDA0873978.1 50S ribosomal protein L30 [Bacteroidota bacterium]